MGSTLEETLGSIHKLTTISEVRTELGCFVRNLEGTALDTTLRGTIDIALLEDLGETLGETLWAPLGATMGATSLG